MSIFASASNQLDHAIYTPAIQPSYAQGVVKSTSSRKLPNGAELSDLNFLNPNSKFVYIPAGLYSAGLVKDWENPPACMVTKRARGEKQTSFIIGDSGGYQLATGQLHLTNNKREKLFHWLTKHCDVAMTLDVPTFPMYQGKSHIYRTLSDCLYATIGHLSAFNDLGAAQHRFLNVLQGEGLHDSDIWYDSVKHYKFFGWAIAGPQKKQMKQILWRVLALMKDGMFDRDETWLHFLGVGDLKTAVLLTKLRDVLRERYPQCQLNISYDTSTPFLLGGKFITAFDLPKFSATRIRLPSHRINKAQWAGSQGQFPYAGSEISRHLTKGDIVRGNGQLDDLGYLMLINHNTEAQVVAVDAVHKLLAAGLPDAHLKQLIPRHLLEAQDAIEAVLLQPTIKEARHKLLERPTLRVLDSAYQNLRSYAPNRSKQPTRQSNAAMAQSNTAAGGKVIDLSALRKQ